MKQKRRLRIRAASAERDRKVEIYTAAKLNIQDSAAAQVCRDRRSGNRDLADLGTQIDALKSELTEKQTEQTQLQERIDEIRKLF